MRLPAIVCRVRYDLDQTLQADLPSCASVSGNDMNDLCLGRLSQLPGEGMLSPAIANQQDPQLARCHVDNGAKAACMLFSAVGSMLPREVTCICDSRRFKKCERLRVACLVGSVLHSHTTTGCDRRLWRHLHFRSTSGPGCRIQVHGAVKRAIRFVATHWILDNTSRSVIPVLLEAVDRSILLSTTVPKRRRGSSSTSHFICQHRSPSAGRQQRAFIQVSALRTRKPGKMVTRKPVGPPLETTNASNDHNPPYPATPIDSSKIPASVNSIYSPNLHSSPAFDLIDMNQARTRPRRDSDVSSHGTWDSEDEDEDEDKTGEQHQTPEDVDMPKPLRLSPSKQNLGEQGQSGQQHDLPAILRPGPPDGAPSAKRKSIEQCQYQDVTPPNPWREEEQTPARPSNGRFESNNPYFRAQPAANGDPTAWLNKPQMPPIPPPNPPSAPPFELPTVHEPMDEFSRLSLRPQSETQRPSYETAETLQVPAKGQAPLPPVTADGDATGQQLSSSQLSAQQPTTQQKWGDSGFYAPPPGPPPKPIYHLIDHEVPEQIPSPKPIPETSELPRRDQASALQGSDRHFSASRLSQSLPQSSSPTVRQQRSEHYQIRNISWYDATHSSGQRPDSGMRRSPVLMQNANGPCPLLALVNALILTTPDHMDTALMETLRTREQISLGLLLDAVFDELMSGRRGDTATQLPDVGELYSFLLALHTGMNVNPRFVTPVSTPRGSLDDHPPDMEGIHPIHRAQSKAGCFEETKEMMLYSTFNVPLIHGWIPPQQTPAYEAFERCAHTFEDAQNIQFAESELEGKLRRQGLSSQEQQTLQDIQTIKRFLANWPTQLTDYGLETISKTLRLGQVAILFRNDHFSTVYKEPRHGSLMTLVTDAGYSSHDEIVWESLVDVNGAASEMFSGDFRPVSHNEDVRLNQSSSAGGEEGWQTVQSRNGNHNHRNRNQAGPQGVMDGTAANQESTPPLPGPRPAAQANSGQQNNESLGLANEVQRTASEQEDHDLALALQLQEEEEAQQRQADERRRREQELSEQFLSQQDEGRPPPIPPRRGGSRQSTSASTRPPANRPEAAPSSNPEAPPTYEQSASDRPYREAGSAARPQQQGSALNAYDVLRRQQSGYTQGSGGPPPGASGHQSNAQPGRQNYGNRGGRTHSTQSGVPPGAYMPQAGMSGNPSIGAGRRPGQTATAQDAEEKCVLM